MAYKKLAEKFDRINKARIKGKVRHTRTGACTCRRTARCQRGKAK